jgi:hypothetical protein
MKEKLLSMKVGEQQDFVFSNGAIKSTKTIYRNSETEWEANCFTSGWRIAYLDLENATNYLTGKLSPLEIDWN